MSPSPIVLHVVRPYASAEEYLAAEGWTIDARAMLLIDAADLPVDTAVLFDVAIGKGEKVIRAEGKVAGRVAPSGDRPGGLRVKFKRYGATTKAFLDRAVQAHRAAQVQPAAMPTMPSAVAIEAAPISLPPVSRASVTEIELTTAEQAAVAPEEPPVSVPEAPMSVPESSAVPVSVSAEPSGVHRRPHAVEAPPNREALLARLRERARHVDLDSFSEPRHTQTG